ncbi:nuclear transport factor 2 family protein [Spirillospora sp. NPDC127200]
MATDVLLADRLEIADLFTRLALLLDEKRWDDAATVFADDAVGRSPRGGEIRGIDALTGFLRRSEVEGERTQHVTTDLLVDLDGDRATASANSCVYFYRDGQAPHRVSGLRLNSVVTRTPAGWRYGEYQVTVAWMRES